MTFVLAARTSDSIFLLADRRLSYPGYHQDDAIKIFALSATDGHGLVGYSGLGKTIGGMEPSDWMSAVVRGRKGTMEQLLGCIASAMKRQFPRHIRMVEEPGQSVIAATIVNGATRIYTISLNVGPSAGIVALTFLRQEAKCPDGVIRQKRVAIAGSSTKRLAMSKDPWARRLLLQLNRYEQGKRSNRAIATYMAKICENVAAPDKAVSRDCIVVWKKSDQSGNHWYFPPSTKPNDPGHRMIPSVGSGIDIPALLEAILPITQPHMEALLDGKESELDEDAMSRAAASVPNHPDEKLK